MCCSQRTRGKVGCQAMSLPRANCGMDRVGSQEDVGETHRIRADSELAVMGEGLTQARWRSSAMMPEGSPIKEQSGCLFNPRPALHN